jgi:hypothetical protein
MSRDIGRSNPRAAGHIAVSIRTGQHRDKTLSVREDYGWLRRLMHRRHQLKSPKALHDVEASA